MEDEEGQRTQTKVKPTVKHIKTLLATQIIATNGGQATEMN